MSNHERSSACTPLTSASRRCLLHALCLLLSLSLTNAHANERIALVIGNDAYRTKPLTQSRNDAVAMAALLRKADFLVDDQFDLDLSEMEKAIERFGKAIRDPSVKFGLFYYSGHGMQQNSHSYLLPVSHNVRSRDDVPKQTVDVSTLVQYLKKAPGRSFVVVLDACRNDPFADNTFKPPEKGLSQVDAPPGTLLAYATTPGTESLETEDKQNEGNKNSLYTSSLLIELAKRNVSVLDAFVNARTKVRGDSNDKQKPLEINLLEGKRLYLFPNEIRILSEKERVQLLEKETIHWIRVKTSTDPEELRRFLDEYPSGNYSELAQSLMNQLNADREAQERWRRESEANEAAQAAARRRVEEARQEAEKLATAKAETDRKAEAARVSALQELAVQRAAETAELARLASEGQRLALEGKPVARPISLPPTPLTTGYDELRRRYSSGDSYNFRVIDQLTGISKPLVMQVTQADSYQVVYNSGEFVSDFMGNTTGNQRGAFSTPRQFYPAELYIGKKWETRFKQSRPNGIAYTFQYDLKVVARETITVPAGTFETYKIEARGFNIDLGAYLERNIWVAPGVNADIAHETKVRLRDGKINENERQELVSFVQALR